jgi:VWFA-related protein
MKSYVRPAIFTQSRIPLSPAFVFSCILLALNSVAFAQPVVPTTGTANRATASGEVYRSNAVISVDSDLVLIPVTITDREGKTITGLEREHFKLFEDAAEQEIVHFTAEDAPASIGIVLDTSGSMRSKIPSARQAVNALLANANPDDEFFLVKFATEAHLVVPLTNRLDDIRFQMETLKTSGTTALLDAVRLALTEMEHAKHERKAIIIISDGEDNSSSWTVSDLKTAVKKHDTVVYGIGIPAFAGERSECIVGQQCGAALLRNIAKQTGGRSFEVNRIQQLPEIVATIGGWLRHQYVLGYVPTHLEKDGAYRKVDLKVERPKGYPKFNAVWRQGYFAPTQ